MSTDLPRFLREIRVMPLQLEKSIDCSYHCNRNAIEFSSLLFSVFLFRNYYQKPEKVWVYLDGSEESVIMIHLARVAVNRLRENHKKKLCAIYFKFDCVESGVNRFFREISDR